MQYAPYLDYRPLKTTAEGDPDLASILGSPQCAWVDSDIEDQAKEYAIEKVAPEHLKEIKGARQSLIDKTRAEVKDRLTKEISHWDRRAAELEDKERSGIEGKGARLNASMARRHADDFRERQSKRLVELDLQERMTASPPVISGGALVIPQGLLNDLRGIDPSPIPERSSPDTQESAARAREITMQAEIFLGFEPTDREFEKLGYDIESKMPDGRLRFIEVKGRKSGADTITVTRNEILYSLNKPDDYILSIVEFFDDGGHKVHYVRRPFQKEPDFGVTSVNYKTADLLARAQPPS